MEAEYTLELKYLYSYSNFINAELPPKSITTFKPNSEYGFISMFDFLTNVDLDYERSKVKIIIRSIHGVQKYIA